MESLQSQIRTKEASMTDLIAECERIASILPQLRNEKREMSDQKRKCDEELQGLRRPISRKKEELNAKKSTIKHFYSETQFATTIKNLKRLLERNTYSLSEEKKYVQEINSLNRSKKQMTEYSVIHDELQKLLDHKKMLQDSVEKSYRTISQKHGAIKEYERKLNQLYIDRDVVKKELERLQYEKHLKDSSRRRPLPSFDESDSAKPQSRAQNKPHAERGNHANQDRGNHGIQDRGSHGNQCSHGNQDRGNHGNHGGHGGASVERRHSERFVGEHRALMAASRSMSEDTFSHDQDRKNKMQAKRKASHKSGGPGSGDGKDSVLNNPVLLCDTLVQYLQARMPTDMEVAASGMTNNQDDEPSASAAAIAEADDAQYRLPRKRADEPRYGGAIVRRVSSKKGKKDRMKMKMVHNMETLSQFATVMLNPPSTLNEVPAVIEQLKERKVFYEMSASKKGIESADTSPCSTGTLEDLLRDALIETSTLEGETSDHDEEGEKGPLAEEDKSEEACCKELTEEGTKKATETCSELEKQDVDEVEDASAEKESKEECSAAISDKEETTGGTEEEETVEGTGTETTDEEKESHKEDTDESTDKEGSDETMIINSGETTDIGSEEPANENSDEDKEEPADGSDEAGEGCSEPGERFAPPDVLLEAPEHDDETESGICTSDSISAYSRSNSNSDCEPKDNHDQQFILHELVDGQAAQEDLLLDDNSNLDLDKPDKLDSTDEKEQVPS